MEYRVVEEESKLLLRASVEKWLKLGWRLQGGVSVHVLNGRTWYTQAMVIER